MSAYLRAPETVLPDTVLHQAGVRDLFASQPGIDRRAARIIGASFDNSGVETRRTVIREFSDEHSSDDDPVFHDRAAGLLRSPSTGTRNAVYVNESVPLFIEAARRALDAADDIDIADVTHLITVSCTGFHAPGPDFAILTALGLPANVHRQHFGFMGCYAAIPALRAAQQYCLADEDAVVLVVSVELCTLHLQSSDDVDTIIASSLFADGAAAALITGRAPRAGVPCAVLDAFATAVAPDSTQHMAWTIGDHGFEMVLSGAVPKVIEANIDDAMAALCAADGRLDPDDGALAETIAHWAVHPGGRDILDRIERRVGLAPAQLADSREVLRTAGNMSSATVLFVLRRILQGPAVRTGDRVMTMAFGPGLTMEGGVMTVVHGASA